MIVLLLIVIVGCILVGWLLPMAFKSERPFGLVGDIFGEPPSWGCCGLLSSINSLLPIDRAKSGPVALFGLSALEAIAAGAYHPLGHAQNQKLRD